MSERVTWEQFYDKIPQYFERADSATTRIFDHAVANPDTPMEVQARVFDINSPDYRKWLSDPEQLAELWQTGSWDIFDADVPLDNMRLGLELRNVTRKDIRAWLYTVPTSMSLDDIAKAGDRRLDGLSPKPEVNWVSSVTRRRLGNLAIPGYLFSDADGFIRKEPIMFSYVYTAYEEQSGMHEYNGAFGVGNIPKETIMSALAPPLSKQDMRYLEQGTATFHTVKVEGLLKIMEALAERGI